MPSLPPCHVWVDFGTGPELHRFNSWNERWAFVQGLELAARHLSQPNTDLQLFYSREQVDAYLAELNDTRYELP